MLLQLIYFLIFFQSVFYRKATDFCLLILYLATMLNSLAIIMCVCIGVGGFLRYFNRQDNTICKCNGFFFISSFAVWMSFISFSYLITLDRSSSKMLSTSVKSGHSLMRKMYISHILLSLKKQKILKVVYILSEISQAYSQRKTNTACYYLHVESSIKKKNDELRESAQNGWLPGAGRWEKWGEK